MKSLGVEQGAKENYLGCAKGLAEELGGPLHDGLGGLVALGDLVLVAGLTLIHGVFELGDFLGGQGSHGNSGMI